jgi:hypothetical protein
LLVAVYFLPSFLVVAIGKGQLQNRHPKARQRYMRQISYRYLSRVRGARGGFW